MSRVPAPTTDLFTKQFFATVLPIASNILTIWVEGRSKDKLPASAPERPGDALNAVAYSRIFCAASRHDSQHGNGTVPPGKPIHVAASSKLIDIHMLRGPIPARTPADGW